MSAADPWGISDYWNFAPPRVHAPEPKARAPKPVPDPEALFMLQRHSLQILNEVDAIRHAVKEDRHAAAALARLETHAENTYKVIRRYLAENVAPAQGDFSA